MCRKRLKKEEKNKTLPPADVTRREKPMAARNRKAEFEYTRNFIDALFAEDMHAKRVYSLANATLGVMTSASLAVSTIGHGLALARGRLNKHAIKQVDRLLSNPGIDVRESFMRWVPYISRVPVFV